MSRVAPAESLNNSAMTTLNPRGYNQTAAPTYSIPTTFARKLADVPKSQHEFYEWLQTSFGELFGMCGAYVPFCCCINPFKIVPQGNAGLLSRFGKVYRVLDPGLYFVNQNTESLVNVNVMTKDNVSLQIDSVLYWHIVDPFVARCHVVSVEKALMERTMTTLRDTVGAHELQSVVANREAIAHEIKDIIDDIALSWGVMVESILIKDLQFSRDLQENLSAAAKQRRIGESKVLAARAEVDSARLMREASDILNTPAAMQIRYLETLQSISKNGTKVVFLPGNGHGSGTGDVAKAFSLLQ